MDGYVQMEKKGKKFTQVVRKVKMDGYVSTERKNISLLNYKNKPILSNKLLRDKMPLELWPSGLENIKKPFGSASNFRVTQVFTPSLSTILRKTFLNILKWCSVPL